MRKKTILIADDQKFALQLLRDILAPHGFIVHEALNGLHAVEKALELNPDLILMDLIMPGMNGMEACRRIKQNPSTSAIPIIVLTANKEKEFLEEAFEVGADDYLNKPFSSTELLARINSNLIKTENLGLLKLKVKDFEILHRISQAISSTLNQQEILRIIVNEVAANIEIRRCSLVRIDDDENFGHVLASSDAPEIEGMRINLDRYPEIQEVIRTGRLLVLDEAKNHPLMEDVREHIADLDIDAILILPINYHNETIGTLMLRTSRDQRLFTSREQDFCQLIANISATALTNAHLYEKACEESGELRNVRSRIEQELREKAVFESLFEHSSEGLLALNDDGTMVYINQSALALIGYSRTEARHLSFADLLHEDNRQEFVANHKCLVTGKSYKKKCDFFLSTKLGQQRHVSVSISEHRIHGDFTILSLTDLSEARRSTFANTNKAWNN